MIGNLLLRHRKLVPCPKPASVCSKSPHRLHPKSSLFFASISKTRISRRLTLSIGNIRQRGPIAGAEMAIKETLNFRSPKSGA